MALGSTYRDSQLHDKWCATYRRNRLQRQFDDRVYEWLTGKLRPSGSWLDAGCGSGEHTVRLARHAPEVTAIDISPAILEVAAEQASRAGLGERIRFKCLPLEELSEDSTVDNVHCRGVLMHIPDWRTALRNLCRCVQPGGYVVLFEGNCRSIEALLVKLVRRISKRRSRMLDSDGGLEFWSELNGRPFLVRLADLESLETLMRSANVTPLFRRPIALLDLNRAPASLRNLIVLLNRLWFRLSLPFGSGVVLVGRKAGRSGSNPGADTAACGP
jgi:ubiquinone/menaquinone biosynthesis C-methylase UbiE